ncbi:MAG: gamma-glutamyltransferase [Actinobacteria bacterium]|nr:gamma-glutamyltransferase [Actinomycetota bacterium]
MNGAIAAGHRLTAEAGASILAGGGNAVDACVAAAFVSWVTESPLTGPGAGGFMLVHRARDRADQLLDFFVAVPGRGLSGPAAAIEPVDVAFDRTTHQRFYVGPATCAVPGALAGLSEAHRRYGSYPWRELVAPAAALARNGVKLNSAQARLHAILDPILRREPDGRRVYGARAARASGQEVVMHDLAETLEVIAEDGAAALFGGELGRRVSDHVRERGGRITADDLASYRVIRRVPVRTSFRGHELVSNPPPSSGGVLVAYALRLLDELGQVPERGTTAALARIAAVMGEAARARGGRFASDLHRGGLASRLLSEVAISEASARLRNGRAPGIAESPGLPSTTHVSVVDSAGNAASLSSSTGAGSGVLVPGTGIHLNNMLGEEDLAASGTRCGPGRRLTSMMSPSVVLRDGRPRLVVGSAGSARLRGAIVQIIANVVDYDLRVEEATAAPRIHLEGARLHLEGGIPAAAADDLERLGYETVRWRSRNLFFGGASAVARTEHGELEAAGDPRRSGAGIVVS